MLIDVKPNPNCPEETQMVYKDIAPPRPVRQVRLYHDSDAGELYDVTGWTVDGRPCPALAQKIDDSGQGTAFAIFGGDGGVRLRPASKHAPWSLEDPEQFGEAYRVATDEADLVYAEAGGAGPTR